jgi:hypothetical protein
VRRERRKKGGEERGEINSKVVEEISRAVMREKERERKERAVRKERSKIDSYF